MRKAIRILLGLLILGATLLTMLYFLQEKLIFLPNKLPANYAYSFGYPFEEINLTTEDGARLNALHFKNTKPLGVILYFHGNAGDLSRWGNVATYFVAMNYDVVIMDYRTYGKSTGNLNKEALLLDAQLFYDYTLAKYDREEIVLYGRSLGTGIASYLAARNNTELLILETPYYSLLDVAKERFPLLPVRRFLKYNFESYEYLKGYKSRVIMIHGDQDRVVPLHSGQKLYKSLDPGIAEFIRIERGEHNNLSDFHAYQEAIKRVLDPAYSNRSEDK